MEPRPVLYTEGIHLLGAKLIGWASIVGGLPTGFLMAVTSESPWGAAGWMGAGFAGLVAGYLLVVYMPARDKREAEERRQNNETLRVIASEHREATRLAVEANRESFNAAADKIVAATNTMRDSFLQHLIETNRKNHDT